MPEELRRACFAVLASLLLVAMPLFLHLPPWVPLLLAAMLGGRAWLLWRHKQLPARIWLLFALIGPVLLLWQNFRTLVGREGGVALLLVLVGIKAFETNSVRDWRVLLALGFFLTAMPLLFDQGVLSALWMLFSLLALTWCLILLSGGWLGGSVREAARCLLYTAPLMVVLFVAMPRLPGPLWQMPTADKRATTGLAEQMSPGSISEMIPSREPAFTAQFPQGNPQREQLYWRVMVFDAYDGEQWRASGLPEPEAGNASGKRVPFTVIAEPFKGRLPALEYAVAADGEVQLKGSGLLMRQDAANLGRMGFTAYSSLSATALASLSPPYQQRYLQLPPGNEQTRREAARMQARFSADSERLQALKSWFGQQRLQYSLTPPVLAGEMVDGFLYGSRQGFCEHFAGAFVFMARAAGLPARVVVGFQGGEFNPGGNFWQVRSSDAHAWAEVWLASRQSWQRVDPTALAVPARLTQGIEQVVPESAAQMPLLGGRPPGWWQGVQQNWQQLGFAWQRWVVNYDAARQQSLWQRLGLGQDAAFNAVVTLLSGALLILLAWFAAYAWRRRHGARGSWRERGWLLLLQRLRLAGMEFDGSATAQELGNQLAAWPDREREQVSRLLQNWTRWRYQQALADDDLCWRDWYREVRRLKLGKLQKNKPT